MTIRALEVRMHGRPVASLIQDESGRLTCTYRPDAEADLSLSLPRQGPPPGPQVTEAFFANLLPESPDARKAIARREGANWQNTFSLLRVIGRDCAGAVSLHEPGTPTSDPDGPVRLKPLTDGELAGYIRDLPRRPLFFDAEGMRISLAGAQEKGAVCLAGGRPAFPLDGAPTTHILKPAIERLPHSVTNEYLVMTLARLIGLPTAPVSLAAAEDVPYLLVERYDRSVAPDGTIARIHQEDFCQALGLPPAAKYETDGGPGHAACFALANRLGRPIDARERLLRLLAFNFLVGNGDAHAKNLSLLRPHGGVQLAPAYDLLSTRFYAAYPATRHDGFDDRMAMKVGGTYHIDEMTAARWRRLSEEIGVGFRHLQRTLLDVSRRLRTETARLRGECDAPGAPAILDFIDDHAARLTARFEAQLRAT